MLSVVPPGNWSARFKVCGSRFPVQGAERAEGAEEAEGLGFRIQGSDFRVGPSQVQRFGFKL